MKHKLTIVSLITLLAGAGVSLLAAMQAGVAKQPIYIFLYARLTDHVNIGITEDRIHRVVDSLQKQGLAHPDARVTATLLFSGAVSDALAKRNGQTHIVDFVKTAISRGLIEPGYDGTDEPTYATRPAVDFTGSSDPQIRWAERRSGEEKFLTQARDPLTGVTEPGKNGGLKRMQEVFGEAACITGVYPLMKVGPGEFSRPVTKARILDQNPKPVVPAPGYMPEVGGDSEAVEIIRTLNSRAIMFGVPDTNPAKIPGFREGSAGFSNLVSPLPDTPPEMYWQDNVLRSSEASNDIVRLVHAYNGAEPLRKLVEKVDRNKVHVIHIELADEQNYLTSEFVKSPDFPAPQFAYKHPDAPQLPADVLRAKADVDSAYASEDALLKWVTEQFLSKDAASGFVSSADLMRMAVPPTGFTVSLAGLQKSLADFLKAWGDDTFAPALFEADGHYLSRAELFQVMADALAEYHRSGKYPASIKVIPVLGPVRVLTGHGPNAGEVSMNALATICAGIAPGLHDNSASAVPRNMIPIGIDAEGIMINPAQFLKLMASAIANPAASPSSKLKIRMTYEFMAIGQLMPRSRPDMDDGFIWTLKPAQMALPSSRSASAKPAGM